MYRADKAGALRSAAAGARRRHERRFVRGVYTEDKNCAIFMYALDNFTRVPRPYNYLVLRRNGAETAAPSRFRVGWRPNKNMGCVKMDDYLKIANSGIAWLLCAADGHHHRPPGRPLREDGAQDGARGEDRPDGREDFIQNRTYIRDRPRDGRIYRYGRTYGRDRRPDGVAAPLDNRRSLRRS